MHNHHPSSNQSFRLNSFNQLSYPQSLVTDDELIESLLNNNNNNNCHPNQVQSNQLSDQQQLDHLLLLSPSSSNSISTASLSPSNPTPVPSNHIPPLSSSQPQPIYHHFHHPIPSADLSIGSKPSLDRFSLSHSPHPVSSSLPDRQPPYPAADHHNVVLAEKRRKRRESHNAVERRRRDNINDRISELASLLPNCVLDTVITPTESGMLIVDEPTPSGENPTNINSKPNKGIVLAKSVDYIKQLKDLLELQVERNAELETQLNNLRAQLAGQRSESQEEWFQTGDKRKTPLSIDEKNHDDKMIEQNEYGRIHDDKKDKQGIMIKTEEPNQDNEGKELSGEQTQKNTEIMIMMNEFCQSSNNDDSSSIPPHNDTTDRPQEYHSNGVNTSNQIDHHLAFHRPLPDPFPSSFDHLNLHLDKFDNLYHYFQ